MAATQYFEQVQKIFIAFYQRPADPAGLKYWAQRVDAAGGDFGAVIDAFASSPEAIDLYGAIDATTIGTVIDSLYMALFNAAPDAAGKAFYVDGFAAGTFTAGTIALAVLNGAQNDDLIAVQNKVQVANEFTEQVDGRSMYDAYFGTGTSFNVTYEGDTDAQAARDILKAVTFDAASVINPAQVTEALKTQIADATDPIQGQTGGQTYTLTKSVETLTGTSGNDTFSGVMDAAVAPAASNSTFQTGDKLVGGAGTDTLNLTVADNAAVASPLVDLDSVEVIKVRNLDTVTGAVTVKADTWTGATEVWSSNSTQDVSVTGLKNIVTAGLENTNEKLTLTIADTAVAGATDTLAIAASNAGNKATANSAEVAVTNVSAAGNVIEAVTVASAGTYNFVDIDAVGNKVKTITVTGAAETKIEADRTAVVTIDASAATGAVNVVDGAGAFAGTATDGITYKGGAGADTIAIALTNKATVTAGAGNDVVALSDVANLTTADSINGGDGTGDVLSLAVADAKTVAANAARTVITGFETLRVTGDFANAAADNFDISKFGINSLQVEGNSANAANTVSNFTSGATVEFRLAADQTNALNIGMKNATDAGTDSDTLNIKLNADLVTQANANAVTEAANAFEVKVGVDGINILNVTTADANNTDGATKATDGYILTLSSAANVTAINVSGDKELSFTSAATTNALKTLDATTLTGNLNVDLSGFGGTQGVEVKGGAGVNTITGTGLADIITGGAKDDVLVGGAGNDKISGGDGKDTITGGTGADILAGGTGVDTFVIATGDSLVATADSITDLVLGVGGDVVKFGTTAATATNLKTLSAAGQANVSAELTLAAAVNKAIVESGDAAKSVVTFTYGTDTYLLYNEATATATFADGTDSLIKITGVTGAIDASNIFVV